MDGFTNVKYKFDNELIEYLQESHKEKKNNKRKISDNKNVSNLVSV